jgi:hypothetical protein
VSTWWRKCKACGALGDDARRCPYCGEFAPFGPLRGDDSDWRLMIGVVLLMGLGIVLVVTLGLLLLRVTGGI